MSKSVNNENTLFLLQKALAQANCILWQALVQETEAGFHWEWTILNETAARRLLPVAEVPGGSYAEAFEGALSLEDQSRRQAVGGQALQADMSAYRIEYPCLLADGRLRWLLEDVTIEATAPDQWTLIGVCIDITDLKANEDLMAHHALHDSLTRLPNRVLFLNRLRRALARIPQSQGSVAVLYIDFDNFKVINDSLGHEAGDQFLTDRAAMIQSCLNEDTTLARLGGDEFVILLDQVADEAEVRALAERVVEQLRQPIALEGKEIFSTASIGIALSSVSTPDAEKLLQDADTAMYHVKTDGKAGYAIFAPHMNDRVQEQMEMESGLRSALERNEFRVYYQPLIDLSTGQIVGLEALVRWQHPTLGLIAPGRFIPVAEESGLIIPMGYWVLEESCRQTKAWQAQFPSDPPLMVSVNISGRQLQRADVVDRVKEALERTGLAPASLKLEITESVMMKNMDETVAKLHELKSLGIKLAIDDFGTGYSSMANLNAFPVDTLKIDRAFVSGLGEQEEAAPTIAAIVSLAKTLGMDITSEGVETEDQVIQLQGLGCTLGQGYLFSKPVPSDDMSEQIAQGPIKIASAPGQFTKEMIEQMLGDFSIEQQAA